MNRSELLKKLALEMDEWSPSSLILPEGYHLINFHLPDEAMAISIKNFRSSGSKIITKQDWLDEKNRLELLNNQRGAMLEELAEKLTEWPDSMKETITPLDHPEWRWVQQKHYLFPELNLRTDPDIKITKQDWLDEKNRSEASLDVVDHPSHYTQGEIECIDAIKAATVGKNGIDAVCTANVIKYLWRYESKNGVEDVKKARWYLELLIKELDK